MTSRRSGNRFPDLREDVEEHIDPLPRDAGADMEHPGSAAKLGEPRQLDRGLGRAGGELGCDPIGSVDQPVGVDQSRPADLLSDGIRVVKHDRGFLHPGQDAAGQGTEPPRPGLATGSSRQRNASRSWQ